MIVKVLEIPVRYRGVTYPSGQFFEMEEEHFNKNIVDIATPEEEEQMGIYSKGADRTRKPVEPETKPKAKAQKAKEPAAASADFKDLSEAELKRVKNDDLKAYLDENNIEYPEEAIKEDYITAILRK